MDTNNREIKHIIDEINNLTPWDRQEIISYIGTEMFDDDDVIEYARRLGMKTENELLNEMSSDELLDCCDSYDIIEYVVNDDYLTKEVIERTSPREIAEAIDSSVYHYDIREIMEAFVENKKHYEELKKWYKENMEN